MKDRIESASLTQGLVGTRFSGKVQHFDTIGSTNSELLAVAAEGAAEGLTFVADEQTAGRGRGGHGWHSSAGDGLYVSALMQPSLKLSDALLLSLATGLAVQQAVHQVTGVTLDIRWPNDLLHQGKDGRTRKCGGILVETAVEPGPEPMLRYAVIGVGLNVHHAAFPEELAELATSLHLAAERPLQRTPLLLAILRHLDLELTQMEQQGGSHAELLQRFTRASSWVSGKQVSVPEDGGYTGATSGLDDRGYLLVTDTAGRTRTVRSGGVREL